MSGCETTPERLATWSSSGCRKFSSEGAVGAWSLSECGTKGGAARFVGSPSAVRRRQLPRAKGQPPTHSQLPKTQGKLENWELGVPWPLEVGGWSLSECGTKGGAARFDGSPSAVRRRQLPRAKGQPPTHSQHPKTQGKLQNWELGVG